MAAGVRTPGSLFGASGVDVLTRLGPRNHRGSTPDYRYLTCRSLLNASLLHHQDPRARTVRSLVNDTLAAMRVDMQMRALKIRPSITPERFRLDFIDE